MDRIKHDVAFATALQILDVFAPFLSDEERLAHFGQIYERVKKGLESYDKETKSLLHRLRPLSN